MSKKIGDILSFLGGPDHAHILIPILEALCSAEETVIRSNASSSVCRILAQFDETNIASASAYLGLLKRLSNDEAGESFYSRNSACCIIDELFRAVKSAAERALVLEIYTKLCSDEMLIVKRTAALAFPKLARHTDASTTSAELFAVYKSFFSAEEHQTVRVIALEGMLQYCRILQKANALAGVSSEVVHLIKSSCEDPSWKIRLAIAKDFGELSSIFPSDAVTADLFPGLLHLLQDPEPEVRILACSSTLPFLSIVSGGVEAFLAEIVPTAAQLTEDTFPNVRKVVAEMVVGVAVAIGSDLVTGGGHVSDLVTKCMADESPIVRLRVVSKLDLLAQKVPALCSRLTSSIVAAQKDPAWRVRKQWCLVMPGVAKHMGAAYFVDNMLALYLELFKDGVNDVRIAMGSSLADMISSMSSPWVYENIFPSVRALSSGDFLLRLTMLESLKSILRSDVSDRFRGEALQLVLSLVSDTVPNVKIAVAKTLTLVCERGGDDSSANRALIRPMLADLEADKDKDVKYFAVEALKICG